MKRTILILMLSVLVFACKKEEKSLIGGKWYHVKTVFNGATTSGNQDFWIEFNEDGYIYTSAGKQCAYTATDEKINDSQYQCKGKELKIQYGGSFCQSDIVYLDFDKNYTQYKR